MSSDFISFYLPPNSIVNIHFYYDLFISYLCGSLLVPPHESIAALLVAKRTVNHISDQSFGRVYFCLNGTTIHRLQKHKSFITIRHLQYCIMHLFWFSGNHVQNIYHCMWLSKHFSKHWMNVQLQTRLYIIIPSFKESVIPSL